MPVQPFAFPAVTHVNVDPLSVPLRCRYQGTQIRGCKDDSIYCATPQNHFPPSAAWSPAFS